LHCSPAVRSVKSFPPLLDTQETPDEVLRATVKSLDKALSNELLDRILAAPPRFL